MCPGNVPFTISIIAVLQKNVNPPDCPIILLFCSVPKFVPVCSFHEKAHNHADSLRSGTKERSFSILSPPLSYTPHFHILAAGEVEYIFILFSGEKSYKSIVLCSRTRKNPVFIGDSAGTKPRSFVPVCSIRERFLRAREIQIWRGFVPSYEEAKHGGFIFRRAVLRAYILAT